MRSGRAVTFAQMQSLVSTPPARISQLAEMWDQVLAAAAIYNMTVERLARAEQAHLDTAADKSNAVLRNEGRVDLSGVRNSIRARIVDTAVELFSPRGARIPIDLNRVTPETRQEESEHFRPLDLWEHLERELGGGRCHETAYRALAKRIVSAFHLREGETVRVVAGRPVLTMGLYWDDRYGGSGWGYSSREGAEKALVDLLPVLYWGGIEDAQFVPDTRKVSRLLAEQKEVPRGLRWPVGAVLELVPFKGKLEFRFSPAAAEAIGLFVSTYGELYPAR